MTGAVYDLGGNSHLWLLQALVGLLEIVVNSAAVSDLEVVSNTIMWSFAYYDEG